MKRTVRAILLAGLLAAGVALNGCLWLAAGAVGASAVYVYKVNQLESIEELSVPELQAAVLAGLADLQIRVTRDSHDQLTGLVEARNAQGQDINIHLNRQTANSTRLTIQVGSGLMPADREQSQAIYEAIEKHF